MGIKRLLCPERLRRPPRQFSWIDQRLVRDKHIGRVKPEAQGLYLFLATVADAQGLSFYGERSICELLHLQRQALADARGELISVGLIAYQKPLYQVLSLGHSQIPLPLELPPAVVRGPSKPESLGSILPQLNRKEIKP